MNRSRALSLVLLASLAGCAGQTWRGEVGPAFMRARGVVALGSSSNNGAFDAQTGNNSIDSNMGLGETSVAPHLRMRTDIGRHRVRMNGLWFSSDGSASLANKYGDIAAGTQVSTSLDVVSVAGSYAYELLREDHYRVAAGAALGYYQLDVSARVLSGAGRESVETAALVPMPYVEAEAFYEDFVFGGSFGIMAADLGDASGRYIDLEVHAGWNITDDFDVKGGYRYMLLDGYGRASGRDFDADVEVQGYFATAGVRF